MKDMNKEQQKAFNEIIFDRFNTRRLEWTSVSNGKYEIEDDGIVYECTLRYKVPFDYGTLKRF